MKLLRSSFVATLVLLLLHHHVDAAEPDIHSNQRLSDILSPTAATESEAAFTAKVKTGEYVKIGSTLGHLVETMSSDVTANDVTDDPSLSNLVVVTTATESSPSDSEVLVDVIFKRGYDFSDDNIPQDFTELGFRNRKCFINVCLGFAKTMNLVQLSQHHMVNFIKPSLKPETNVGSVTSEGDMAMNTDLVRDLYGLSGNGITVGVLSDSFECDSDAATDYATDVASGDLPDNVDVLQDLTSDTCIDEGRAMLQLVHDVVPSANLAFRTALLGANDFAQGILDLAEAGCDVIVDDIGYFIQPFFQDNVVTQAADTVSSQGIPYFSSAGNNGRRAWHTDTGFVDSGVTFNGGALHNFGTTDDVDEVFVFRTRENTRHQIELQWDEPFASVPGSAGCQSDVDLLLVDLSGRVLVRSEAMNIDGDAVEQIIFNSGPEPNGVFFGLAIVLKDGPAPGYMKIQLQGRTPAFAQAEYDMVSSTLYAHKNAVGGAGVGAASWELTPPFGVDPAVQEDFSSAGGTPIFFDTAGNRLDSAEVRDQPRFVGPDRGITTFFLPPSNRFPGTSAAAPHVAALAALMLEADSTLTPNEIYTILEDTADDMDDTATDEFDVGFDFGTGYGFVQGDAALAMVVDASPTPAPTPIDDVSPTPAPTPIDDVSPTLTPSAAPTADPEGCASCDKDVCGAPNRCLFRDCSRSTGVWLCERRREVTENGCGWNGRNTWQCESCARKGSGRLCCKGCGLVVEEEGLSLGDVSS